MAESPPSRPHLLLSGDQADDHSLSTSLGSTHTMKTLGNRNMDDESDGASDSGDMNKPPRYFDE
jgi:hypothetical protein